MSTTVGRTFKKVVERLLKGESVFIKDTGIKVIISRLQEGRHNRNRLKHLTCNIVFEDAPSYKALKLCENYDIRNDNFPGMLTGPNQMNNKKNIMASGVIKVLHLSNKPYESNAGKILFDKK